MIAVIILAFKGLILWNYGILMIIGAILGGYLGGEVRQGTQQTDAALFRAGHCELLHRRLLLDHVRPSEHDQN
jgi:uncharacterized protein YcfJ